MAVAEKTLLEFLLDLLHDKDALADFRDNPEAALHDAGLGDCSVDELKALMPIVLEKVDAEKCARYEDDCDDDKCWDSEPKHDNDREHHHKPVDCDDEGRPAPHCSPIEQSIAHLNYVTNNYNFVDNSHDTYNETNNITKIWAGDDADIHVDNTTTNVGEHGAFVGGDNNAPLTTGDGNVVGDDNAVSGAGSTTAFGDGPAVSAHSIDGGDHSGIVFGTGAVSTVDASTDNSHQDNSVDSSTDNSHQDNSVKVHDESDNSTNTDASIHDNKLLSDNDLSHTDDASHGGEIHHDSLLPL